MQNRVLLKPEGEIHSPAVGCGDFRMILSPPLHSYCTLHPKMTERIKLMRFRLDDENIVESF